MARRVMKSAFVAHIPFLIAMSLGLAAPVGAQPAVDTIDTRAEAAAAGRDEKSRNVSAPKRSLVERALNWYDTHGARLQWRAVHFTGGSFPGGAGFAYGVGVTEQAMGSDFVGDDQPNRIDGDAFAAQSLRGYRRFGASMDVRNLLARPIDLAVRWQEYELPQEDFYGLGAGTPKSMRSNYRLDGNEYGTRATWRPTGTLSVGSDLSYLTAAVGSGTDSRYASIETVFDEDKAPGMSDLPSFIRGDVFMAFDWRDSDTHPRRGGRYQASLARFDGVNDDAFDFERLDISAQQIVPLPNRYRRIELRAGAALTHADGNRQVPFIHQPAIGGPETLRGYGSGRFRDQNAVWASAEYQWEAWWALDGAFFVDAGQVAAERSDFNLNALDVTYGIGFRLHGNENFIARLDLAYGREGFHPVLGFKYGF
jgi:hypothetical protein